MSLVVYVHYLQKLERRIIEQMAPSLVSFPAPLHSSHSTPSVCGFICRPSHSPSTTDQNLTWTCGIGCNSRLHVQLLTDMTHLWGNLVWVQVLSDLDWLTDTSTYDYSDVTGQQGVPTYVRHIIYACHLSELGRLVNVKYPMTWKDVKHRIMRPNRAALEPEAHRPPGFNILSVLMPGLQPERLQSSETRARCQNRANR